MKTIINHKISSFCRMQGEDFKFFIKYYFKHYFKFSSAPFHNEINDILKEKISDRGARVAIAAPRESAKSTIISLMYVVYCICYKKEDFIIIISNTSKQSEGALTHVKKELETNKKLIEDFPEICEIGQKPAPERWRSDEIYTRNDVRVIAIGSGQQIRGVRNNEHRPSLIILDDAELGEGSATSEGYDKIHNWFTKTILKLGDNDTNIFVIGTIHHYNSLLSQLTDPETSAGWEGKKYQSVITWSKEDTSWQSWSKIFNNKQEYNGLIGKEGALKYFQDNKEKMLEGTKVLWPEKYDYYKLMTMRERDGWISFDCEMQNEPVNPKESIFNLEEIHYWDDQYASEEELLRDIGVSVIFFGACDPSVGKKEGSGDYTAIINVAYNIETGIIYTLDADIGRYKPDQTIEHILAHHYRRNYVAFICETNQFQDFFAQEIINQSAINGNEIALARVNHTSSKQGRIRLLQPFIKNGKIRFSRKHRELLKQMGTYPRCPHDDGLDALEMVFTLCKTFEDYEEEEIIVGEFPKRIIDDYNTDHF